MILKPIIQQDSVAIYELLGSGDGPRVEALLSLYARLFPQYAHYVPRMRRRAPFPSANSRGHVVHYWLVEVDGQPAGLRTFRCIPARRCGLAHALAVDPAFRKVNVGGKRLSTFIIYNCLEQVIRDAEALGQPPVWGMVNEVEYERLMQHYNNQGIIELPVRYVEPIFPPPDENRTRERELELIEFSPMFLGLLPNPALLMASYHLEVLTDFVLAFLVDHYGLPEEHPEVCAVLASILAGQ
jgi:GNAT superfamily N-acetyltransferase